jgi:hypothetical protein
LPAEGWCEVSREITEEVFLKDVAHHEMKVLMDNGLYRHLRFQAKGKYSWNQWFDIVTWPGRLVYTGDMGTYVFARLEDMFEFFRTHPSESKGLYINTGYWGEKLQAVDRCGRACDFMEFSPERLKNRVEDAIKEWVEEFPLEFESSPEEESAAKAKFEKELREAIKEDIYSYLDDGEHEAQRALNDFSFEPEVGRFVSKPRPYRFSDTWEWDMQEYTGRFVWCCYALAWSIKQYDALTAGVK